MELLTKRQKEILDFIHEFTGAQGYAPSYREIAKHFNLSSTATIHEHIKTLKDKGYLESEDNSPRSLEVIEAVANFARAIELPLVGLITAGQPIEAVEERESFAVPASLIKDEANTFVLKVKGDSMIDEGIHNGDYVIVERNPSPTNGDVVVALLENSHATLKKYYREDGRIRLQPANKNMQPIFVKDCIIQGTVKAVIRQY
jgi:repressor LexA